MRPLYTILYGNYSLAYVIFVAVNVTDSVVNRPCNIFTTAENKETFSINMLNLGNDYIVWEQKENSSLKLQLIHRDLDKMGASSQATYSNAFL